MYRQGAFSVLGLHLGLLLVALAGCACLSFSCAHAQGLVPRPANAGANSVHVTLLHLNDCYELMPSGGSDLGGVARVASLQRRLKAANPNTLTLLAGDLFAPSALSNTPIPAPSGPQYQGIQMVQAMNAIGVDYACLGNHETDVKIGPFTSNMIASNFTWLSANAQLFKYGNKLNKSAVTETAPDANGRSVRIGLVGLTIDLNNRTGVQTYHGFEYSSNVIAPSEIASLNAQGADMIVALTHFDWITDMQLVERAAGIHIVVGGHDHTIVEAKTTGKATVYKADANVRTVWVHDIWIDTSVPRTDPSYFVHVPTLVTVNASLPDDPYTSSVIRPYWINGTRSFEALGFAPMQAVCTLPVELDVRNDWLARGTSLTGGLFAQSIYDSGIIQTNGTVTPDLAFFNVNTFRIDDVLPAGTTLSQYDVLRIVPFADKVYLSNMTGAVLEQVFTTHLRQVSLNTTAGVLAFSNVTQVGDTPGQWMINGEVLKSAHWYVVASSDFLLQGKNALYAYLSPALSPGQVVALPAPAPGAPGTDARIAFISKLSARFAPPVSADSSSSSSSGSADGSSSSGSDGSISAAWSLASTPLLPSFLAAYMLAWLLQFAV